MKKFISLISAAAMAVTSFSAAAVNTAYAEDEQAIKIMCIGDSITDGYGVAGSYRKFLYHGLTEKGYNIDMTGAKGGGWTPAYTDEETGETFEYDDENTGYSGYAIKEYPGRSGIYETLQSTNCLAETQPDIVILQIGTNDTIDNHELDDAGERLETLIYYILNNIPETSTLFVTTIPDLDPNRSDVYDWFGNYRHSADWVTQYTDEEVEVNVQASVDKYNSIVKNTVQNVKHTLDSMDVIPPHLLQGDINSVITDVASQLGDGVHPNNTGYKLMGEYWTDVIDSYLKGNPDIEEPAETTTTAPSATTTTTAETAVTTTTTTVQTEEPITTTEADTPAEEEYKVADLVKLVDWLHKFPTAQLTDEEAARLDMDKNQRLDVFDLVLLRKELIETGQKLIDKLNSSDSEVFDAIKERGSLLDGNIVLYPEDYEEKKVTSSNSAASTIVKSVNTSLTDLDETDEDPSDIQITTKIVGFFS